MQSRITLQDIADQCGFSKSMVAQVMRNPVGSSATQNTKKVILETARKLNYRPNHAAKVLSTNQNYTIGVIMPSIGGFYYELAVELESVLTAHGYYSLFSYWTVIDSDGTGADEAIARIIQHGVDGIITVQYYPELAEIGVPVVTYGNERQLMDCVYPNKVKSLREAVKYLIEKGHRKIAFIGMKGDVRQIHVRDIFNENGIEVNEDWIIEKYHTVYEDGYKAMRDLLEGKEMPTALITHSDLIAIGAIKFANEAGIRIPDDISIISYDNLRQAEFSIPALSTFDQCYKKAASLLVKAIMERIKNPNKPQQKYSFEMPLVERDSVKNITHIL